MWTRIKLTPDPVEDDDKAYVTIGNSKLHFGLRVCRLIPDAFSYRYVTFLRNEADPTQIAVHFCNETGASDSDFFLPLHRYASQAKKNLREHSDSCYAVGTDALRCVFGELPAMRKTHKMPVKVCRDMPQTLVIDVAAAENVNKQTFKADRADSVPLFGEEDK